MIQTGEGNRFFRATRSATTVPAGTFHPGGGT